MILNKYVSLEQNIMLQTYLYHLARLSMNLENPMVFNYVCYREEGCIDKFVTTRLYRSIHTGQAFHKSQLHLFNTGTRFIP